MLRSGLRSEDVTLLARAVREARESGVGPDEAWARAAGKVTDVEPEVVEAWRGDVEAAAETVAPALGSTTTNVHQRVQEQDSEIASLKRDLADLGLRYERSEKAASELREQLAAAEDLLGEKRDPEDPEGGKPKGKGKG